VATGGEKMGNFNFCDFLAGMVIIVEIGHATQTLTLGTPLNSEE
jgi:hypothetical protein